MNPELLQKALDIIKKFRSGYGDDYYSEDKRNVMEALKAELAKPKQDWDLLKATQESLREHMARIKELEAELAKQKALDKKAENARELGLDYEPEQEPVSKYSDIVSDGGLDPRNKCDTAQVEQEPVEHLWECLGRWSAYLVTNGTQANMAPPTWLSDAVKAATAPPRKEWIGLTDKEEIELDEKTWLDINAYLEARDAKLKEKNNAV